MTVQQSKFLSLVLRHRPDVAGLTLDEGGWCSVDALLAGCAAAGHALSRHELEAIVRSSDKQRFAISPDGTRIRANQGHSVEVDLGYAAAAPPDLLYHGTAEKNLAAIRESGLLKGKRHHVHLSPDPETAIKVGSRHGKPVVLKIAAGRMAAEEYTFYLSTNGVWLTDHVPARFLEPEGRG